MYAGMSAPRSAGSRSPEGHRSEECLRTRASTVVLASLTKPPLPLHRAMALAYPPQERGTAALMTIVLHTASLEA
jgi:hypothetical protein